MTVHICYSVKARTEQGQVFVEIQDCWYPPDWELLDADRVGDQKIIHCSEPYCDKQQFR